MTGDMRAPQAAALDELKAFLRVEMADEDALLQGLLRSATASAESFLGQLMVARDLVERGDAGAHRILLRGRPLVAVLAVNRLPAEGGEEPMVPEDWHVDRLSSGAASVCFRTVTDVPVLVRYRAGMAEDWNGLAEPLRFAVVRAAAHAFTHRDRADDIGFPPMVWQLLAPWRAVAL